MRLFTAIILAGILSFEITHAQTVPAAANKKTPSAIKKTSTSTAKKTTAPPPPPHPVHVGPFNGPIKRDGTVNTTYKARKEASQNKSLPAPTHATPNKATPTVYNSNSK